MVSPRRAPVGAVIVAAGRSQRLGQDKLFVELANVPVLALTLRAFDECPAVHGIALVLSEANYERGAQLVEQYALRKVCWLCVGGERRQDSVRAGLEKLSGHGFGWVAIHDGARPLVTAEVIETGIEMAKSWGAAIAAVPIKETIKVVGMDGFVEDTPDRSRLWSIQTPQVFSFDLIVAAHQRALADVTDDAALVEQMGVRVRVYRGSYENLKITTSDDLELAETLLRRRTKV